MMKHLKNKIENGNSPNLVMVIRSACLLALFPNHFAFTLRRYLFLLFGSVYLMWRLTIVILCTKIKKDLVLGLVNSHGLA